MTATLIEDADAMAADGSMAGRTMAAMARDGVPTFIANCASRPMLLALPGRSLPVTVDDGALGASYVSSPHSAYVLYAREELRLLGLGASALPARAALGVLDRVLRAAEVNRAVHLANWMLSTNLHGDWDGTGLGEARRVLADRFPDHLIVLRSLDPWSSPALLDAARADGWTLVPSRQVWVVDDLARDCRPRHSFGNDRRAVAASGLGVEEPAAMTPADALRIADLYRQLYVGKYSALNPVFTPAFVALTHGLGLLRYRVARGAGGRIMAVAGMLVAEGVMTPPVVGYDTGRPRSEALYRTAAWMFTDWAMARGLRLHGSAGAADFKRQRGARGVIEYMGIFTGHLARGRRLAVAGLARALEALVVPVMQRRGW